jgi:AcrR family transcriptional regulator
MGRPAGPSGDTRRRILAAALDLFAERGYHATSMRDLARAVGVRESALYHHFSSKERILETVVHEQNLQSRALAAEHTERLRTRSLEQILAGLAEMTLVQMREPTALKLMRIALSFGPRGLVAFPKMLEMRQQTLARWNVLVDVLKAQGRIRADTMPEVFWYQFTAPLMLASGTLFQHLEMPPAELKRFLRGHIAALVRAFGTEHAAALPAPAKLNERSIQSRPRRRRRTR